jgi:Ricin-type beta-trefoil lectin domain
MRLISGSLLTAAALGITLCTVGTPSRAGGTGYHFHLESHPQFCMDARGDSGKEGTEVWLYKCNETDAQRWAVTNNADGWNLIIGPGGMCLDARGGDTKTGTPLQLWKCHFGKNQRFRFESGQIVEEQSKKCVGVAKQADKEAVRLEPCNGSWNRRWLFEYNRK